MCIQSDVYLSPFGRFLRLGVSPPLALFGIIANYFNSIFLKRDFKKSTFYPKNFSNLLHFLVDMNR